MESKCVLSMINEINGLSNEFIKQEIEAMSIPVLINHIPLFYILPEDGQPMEFRDLRQAWNISKSSLSDILHKYEALGYVDKDATCDDKRCVMIRLTSEGIKLKKQFVAIEAKILNNMLSDFSDSERDTLEKDFVRILGNMKTNN